MSMLAAYYRRFVAALVTIPAGAILTRTDDPILTRADEYIEVRP